MSPILKKTKKDDIRQLQEFVTTKRPKDQFKELDPLKQKVDISSGLAYQGTSQNDVFQNRIQVQEQNQALNDNKFLQLPHSLKEEIDPDFIDKRFSRTTFLPYQQKVFYEVKSDSSDIDQESDSVNDDVLFAQEQPYVTPTSIGHKEMLKQVPVQELGRRSDVMLTSTLSLSIFPKDKRKIKNTGRAQLTKA